jgi:CheY-like chemotaxis protein
VLYIEDNAANLKVVEAMLRHQPELKLISATNGEYGLELAKRYRPDVILLDIHLPGMDGYAVLKALKADSSTRDIPVLALSADAMPIDVETGIKAGFVDYLTKPVKIERLVDALLQVLNTELEPIELNENTRNQ